MKKVVFILFIIGFLLGSCSDFLDAPVVEEFTGNVGAPTTSRSEQDAIQIALDACLRMYGKEVKSRGFDGFNIVKTYAKTSHARSDEFNELYIVNFPDSSGYAIVPASDQLPELVAITESGSIASIEDIEVPMAKCFIYDALTPNATVIDTNKVIISQQIYEYDTTVHVVASPKVAWNLAQNGPEGSFYKNGVAGCTNIAAATILAYFESPNSLSLTFTEKYYKPKKRTFVNLNWSNIKKHTNDPKQSLTHGPCNVSSEVHQQLAEVCAQLGYMAGAEPKTLVIGNKTLDATATAFESSVYQLQRLLSNKSSAIRNEINSLLAYDISRGIVMMSGTDTANNLGHVWIADGCRWTEYWLRTYVRATLTGKGKLVDERYCTSRFVHFNWGWAGKENGYFYINNSNPTFNPYKEGSEKFGGHIDIENYNFKVEKYAVFI